LRGRRATGVELDDGSDLAAGLVVLSAGALNTPALLASSGIALGRPRQGGGQSHGEVAIEDHPSFTFTVGLREGASQPVEPVVPISGLLRWSSSGWDAVGCDLMALVMDNVGVGEAGRRHGAVIVVLTGARSTGRLSTGASRTEFDPGWLDRPGDRERFRTGVRHVGELLGSEALAPVADGVFLDDRGTPLAALAAMSDLDLDRWLRRHPGPVSHAAASTRLGAGSTPGALLTGDGGVAGVDRLHVVDASVLPHLPSANPHLPVVAVAERLAAGLPS
jgi:choline dehydrogenase-like flavoprotein